MGDIVVNKGASGPAAVIKKAISFDFGTIATVSTKDVTGTFSDDDMVVDANDGVYFSPQVALTAGLVNGGARVSATGVVQCRLGNLTAGTLTPNTVTFDVYVIKGGAEV
jgi:hypothetical protein